MVWVGKVFMVIAFFYVFIQRRVMGEKYSSGPTGWNQSQTAHPPSACCATGPHPDPQLPT